MSLTRKWSILATLLIVAIFAASWYLLIAPKRSKAAELEAQTLSQEDANARLLQKLSVLKAQQADLPKQRATLAVLRTQIPNNPSLPTLIRNLTSAGRKVGADITALSPSVPTILTGGPPVAAAATGTQGTAAPATAASLYQVPLSLTVNGTYFELEQFVNRLEGLKRSFLVTGFTVTTPEDEEAPGELELVLQGRVFLSPPASAVATTPTTTGATTPVAQ